RIRRRRPVQVEGVHAAALGQHARDRLPVLGDLSLEGGIAGRAGEQEGDRAALERDRGERQVLGSLCEDRHVARERAVVLVREVDIEGNARSGNVDGALPVPLDRGLGGGCSGRGGAWLRAVRRVRGILLGCLGGLLRRLGSLVRGRIRLLR